MKTGHGEVKIKTAVMEVKYVELRVTGALKILIRRVWASWVGLTGAPYRSEQKQAQLVEAHGQTGLSGRWVKGRTSHADAKERRPPPSG